MTHFKPGDRVIARYDLESPSPPNQPIPLVVESVDQGARYAVQLIQEGDSGIIARHQMSSNFAGSFLVAEENYLGAVPRYPRPYPEEGIKSPGRFKIEPFKVGSEQILKAITAMHETLKYIDANIAKLAEPPAPLLIVNREKLPDAEIVTEQPTAADSPWEYLEGYKPGSRVNYGILPAEGLKRVVTPPTHSVSDWQHDPVTRAHQGVYWTPIEPEEAPAERTIQEHFEHHFRPGLKVILDNDWSKTWTIIDNHFGSMTVDVVDECENYERNVKTSLITILPDDMQDPAVQHVNPEEKTGTRATPLKSLLAVGDEVYVDQVESRGTILGAEWVPMYHVALHSGPEITVCDTPETRVWGLDEETIPEPYPPS